MGILSTLLGVDDTRKISKKEFQEKLNEIPELTGKEKEYLKAFFENELENGLTLGEVKQGIHKLKHNYNDSITEHEVEELRKKLIEELKQK
ncbi:MAG TPA: hypothetical protein VMW82_01515 [Candidatus Paceibacterota bacterium]|nr:hypothetical protein [Candidatus Paceibacterota bacterium]